VLSRGDTRGDA